MKKVEHTCDINGCRREATNHKETKLQVIFVTDQTEGRSTKPYFSEEEIDMCNTCFDKIIEEGKYVHAKGAMGHNDYYFSAKSK